MKLSEIPKDLIDKYYSPNRNKMYSREEVETLLFNLAEHYGGTSSKSDINDFNQWIKDNL